MHAKLERLHTRLAALISGMTVEQLAFHPEGKWCAGEVLEHLDLTYTGTIKNLERCLAAGKPGLRRDRRTQRWRRFVITRLGYFPGGRQSPERVRPRGAPPERVAQEIFANISRMDGLIADCENRFGKRKPIADYPILAPLTAEEWRQFHLVHGFHHAKQIARLKHASS